LNRAYQTIKKYEMLKNHESLERKNSNNRKEYEKLNMRYMQLQKQDSKVRYTDSTGTP